MKNNRNKPLSKILDDFYKTKPRTPPYVIFMAVKEEIAAALAAGCRVSEIWEALTREGRIQCQYTTFARYVREYIRDGANKRRDNSMPDSSEAHSGRLIRAGGAASAGAVSAYHP